MPKEFFLIIIFYCIFFFLYPFCFFFAIFSLFLLGCFLNVNFLAIDFYCLFFSICATFFSVLRMSVIKDIN